MFDLFRSREKSVRYLIGALLTLVALSMVITLVPGYGGGWGSGGNQDARILAEIGDEKVTDTDIRQFMSREMRNNPIPKGMEQFYVPMIVDQMVAQKAVAYQANRMGIKVTDAQLAEIVRSMIPQLFEGGKFVGKDIYAGFLAQQNMTIAQFEENVRTQAIQSRLEALALEGIIVTPNEVETEYKRRNEKIKVAYFSISPATFKGKITVSPAEVETYFNANRVAYMVPEKRSFLIFPIEEAKIAATFQLPEAELRNAYAKNQERYRTPERVKARHILLMTTNKSPAEVTAIQKKIEDILKQVKAGGDFAELAKKNSEDPGSKVKGGDLDWVTRGQMVPEFEKATFDLKAGEISGVVKTQYGFHIIKAEAHEQARLKPFEEVKAELAAEVSRAQAVDKMQKLADQIRATLVKSAPEAEKLALANGITPVHADKAGNGDPIQEVGVNQGFTESGFSLPVNGVTPVIQVSPTKLVIAKVAEIIPARPAELKDVEKSVREALINERATVMAREKTQEAAGKLNNTDFTALAKLYGAEIKTSDMVNREGTIIGIGQATNIDAGFSKPVGGTFGPNPTPEGNFFCKVLEKEPADLTQLAAQRDTLLFSLKQQKSQERAQLFREGVVQALVKEKKVKVYQDNIRKLAAGFRG